MRAHASTSCAACLWCLLVGLGAKPARAAPPNLDPAVSIRLQSALELSLEYGEHDYEFLKNNFVEVRAGRYELYYSESVWTEQPEQTTITLLVTVTQYDMGARFKNFTPDSERPCVRVLLPADCLSRDHCLTGEHHECGKSHFSFQYLGSRRNPPLLFHATLVGPQGEFITDSDTMTIEFVPLPWWRPLGLQSAPPATARTHHATPNSHRAPAALRVAFTFLADASDIQLFLSSCSSWQLSFGKHEADRGWPLHVFVTAEALHAHSQQQNLHRQHTCSSYRPCQQYDSSMALLKATSKLAKIDVHFDVISAWGYQKTPASATSWPGTLRRHLRVEMLVHGKLLKHAALRQADHLLWLDAGLNLRGGIDWDAINGMLDGSSTLGDSIVDNLHGDTPLVATSYPAKTIHAAPADGVQPVAPLHYNRGLLRRCLDRFATADTLVCPAPEGHQDWCNGSVLALNVACPGFGQDAHADSLQPLNAGQESHAGRRRVLASCNGGSGGGWNRVIHLSSAFYFHRSVLDSPAFRNFVDGLDVSEGVSARLWTAEAILTVWALVVVPQERWRDMSAAMPRLHNPRTATTRDDLVDTFPLNTQLRPVHDIFAESMDRTEVLEIAVNDYVGELFRTPVGLWNRTCSFLSPQMWRACTTTILQEYSISDFLAMHGYERDSGHSLGYRQLEAFLSRHSQGQASYGDKDAVNTREAERSEQLETTGAGAPAPVVSSAYIARIRSGFVDANGVHAASYATVFDANRMLLAQPSVRDACTHYYDRSHVKIRHIARLIVGNNVVYPTSYGHFLHEILPRVIWMAKALPEEIPILMILTEQIREVMAVLVGNGVPVANTRLIPWEPDMILYGSSGLPQSDNASHRNLCLPYGTFRPITVVAADEIYLYGEHPYNQHDHPNAGGHNSFHPRPLVQQARRALVLPSLMQSLQDTLVMIKRPDSGWGRGLSNHDQVLQEINKLPAFASKALRVHVFEGEGSIIEQMSVFASARAVVGPHGAGFSNLMFAPEGTTVVEIGWRGDGGPGRRLNGKQGMWLSDMYYSLSCALGLDYWLVLAHTGDQVSPLTVDVEHVLAALDEIGPRQQGQD